MTAKEIVLAAMRQYSREAALDLRGRAVSGGASPTEVIDEEQFVPCWRAGSYPAAGVPVAFESEALGRQVYAVWQPHDSSGNPDWNPAGASSLFYALHTKNPDKAKAFVQPTGAHDVYRVDECLVENGVVYRCVVDTCAYPPSIFPEGYVRL